jgi:hypothetical protein
MKIFSALIITLGLGGLLLVAAPQQAAAACDPKTQIETSFAFGGTRCFNKDPKKVPSDTSNPIFKALLTIFNFLAVGVGILATGGIVFGAIQYITSNGDAGKAKQGVTVIMNAVIGVFLFIFMYAILNFVVPGGLFR